MRKDVTTERAKRVLTDHLSLLVDHQRQVLENLIHVQNVGLKEKSTFTAQ